MNDFKLLICSVCGTLSPQFMVSRISKTKPNSVCQNCFNSIKRRRKAGRKNARKLERIPGFFYVRGKPFTLQQKCIRAGLASKRKTRLPYPQVAKIIRLRKRGASYSTISKIMGIGKTTVHRYCKRWNVQMSKPPYLKTIYGYGVNNSLGVYSFRTRKFIKIKKDTAGKRKGHWSVFLYISPGRKKKFFISDLVKMANQELRGEHDTFQAN